MKLNDETTCLSDEGHHYFETVDLSINAHAQLRSSDERFVRKRDSERMVQFVE